LWSASRVNQIESEPSSFNFVSIDKAFWIGWSGIHRLL